jgi:RNA polymerase sigma-70 factor (ECF subfamily)
VFNLYTIEGYSHQEIAAFLHITESTSRWHLTEARKRLRKIINENA